MSQEQVDFNKLHQQREVQPGEADYSPPVELVPLPSNGLIYPQLSPLHMKETLEIRAMTARDEDILSSRALLKQGKAFTTLVKSCIVNKSIDVDDMIIGDRNAVLIAVRITGYGQEYIADVTCPSCEEETRGVSFDLAQLPVKRLGVQPIAVGKNEFSFMLPVWKKNVVFKLTTGKDETEASAIAEKMKKIQNGLEQSVTMRLKMQIISIDNITDRNKIDQMVRNMPARDSRELRIYMDDIAPGVEMKQLFTCPQCGASEEVEVPFGTEFFWPTRKK